MSETFMFKLLRGYTIGIENEFYLDIQVGKTGKEHTLKGPQAFRFLRKLLPKIINK